MVTASLCRAVLSYCCRRGQAKRRPALSLLASHRSFADAPQRDLPQHGLVRLAFDPPHECWIIQHDMTGQRVRLPGGKSRVWQLGHDDAGAVFVVCSEESIWCDELFSLRLVVDNDGATFVVDEASESGQVRTI